MMKLTGPAPAEPGGVVATDGSVRNGVLAWAWVSNTGGWHISVRQPQRQLMKALIGPRASLLAELYGLASGCQSNPSRPLELLSDSTAAIDLVRQWIDGTNLSPPSWYVGNRLHGFARNVGLRNPAPPTLTWVAGHRGHPLNEAADTLARLGSRMAADGLTKDEVRTRAGGIVEAFTAAAVTGEKVTG